MFPIQMSPQKLTRADLELMINNLDTCPIKNSGTRVVMPVGDGSSGVFVIGEAPGAKEDQLGEPFVGASGKFLNNILLPSVGLNRQNIYLTNIVKCRPPNNRDPEEVEKQAWSMILISEILQIQPKVIVCLGRHSMNFFLPGSKISHIHGQTQEVEIFPQTKYNILPLYHPAVALYNPKMREVLQADFLEVKQFIKKPKDSQNNQIDVEKLSKPKSDSDPKLKSKQNQEPKSPKSDSQIAKQKPRQIPKTNQQIEKLANSNSLF